MATVDGTVVPAQEITATCTCAEDPFGGGSNTGTGNGTARGRLYVETVAFFIDPIWANGSATSGLVTVDAAPVNINP